MAGGSRRLVLEGAFLVGLAVAAGLAEFSTQEIIVVMALGWLVTVLIELVAWRLSLRKPVVVQEEAIPVPAPVAPPAPVAAAAPEPEPAPDAEPEAAAAPEEAVARAEQEPEDAAVLAAEEAGGLRPAEPKRGGIFGWRRREETVAEITDETPAPPRHVRLIERPAEDDEHAPAGDHDVPPAERAKGA